MLSLNILNQWLEYVEAVSGSLLNRGSASSTVTASAIRSWCVPAQGFFICKVNASWNNQSPSGGSGMVLLDSQGSFVAVDLFSASVFLIQRLWRL
jgi:hypothetical protein